jgi:hypothetical protein
VVVEPYVPRAFDGFDARIEFPADDASGDSAELQVSLQTLPGSFAPPIPIPLGRLLDGAFRRPIDEFGGVLIAQVTPGEQLRVDLDGASCVFSTGQLIRMSVSPGSFLIDSLPKRTDVTLQMKLRHGLTGELVWQSNQSLSMEPNCSWPLAIPGPASEGAYELQFTAARPRSLSQRILPGEFTTAIATRTIELVVVDAEQRRPELGAQWHEEAVVDPSISGWRQKLPEWAQLPRLAAGGTRRMLGNTVPVLRPRSDGQQWVELATREIAKEPAWLAYELEIASPGSPYAVELELPADRTQSLAVCFVEPDQTGRVTTVGQSGGADYEALGSPDQDRTLRHRLTFWPQTTAPLLLLANRSAEHTAQFGSIRVLRREVESVRGEAHASRSAGQRMIAAYIAQPQVTDILGARQKMNSTGDLAVEGWQTFLDAGTRLVQQLKADGMNAAIISVAADGSCLAPLDGLGQSPRYDAESLSGDAADPVRKDVLELWLRLFDSEGLKLIPAIQLSAPLPLLEACKDAVSSERQGIETIGDDGRSWTSRHATQAAYAPHYNLLNLQVQESLRSAVLELYERYRHHASLGGVALQVSGKGYGVLPGTRWGLDDATIERFHLATGLDIPGEGLQRFSQRAEFLTHQAPEAWIQWRREQVTQFYGSIARELVHDDAQAKLILCLEDVLQGSEAAGHVRRSLARRGSLRKTFDEIGLDLEALSRQPGIVVPRPRLIRGVTEMGTAALDQRFSRGSEIDAALAGAPNRASCLFHRSELITLPSFASQSPFDTAGNSLRFVATHRPCATQAAGDLAVAMAQDDPLTLLIGGDQGVLGLEPRVNRLLRTWSLLPAANVEVQTIVRQPITLRIYRESGVTTVAAVNESPWPTQMSIALESQHVAPWVLLGSGDPQEIEAQQDDEPSVAPTLVKEGSLPAGETRWEHSLAPHELVAWRFETPRLRVLPSVVDSSPAAIALLQSRIVEFESRMRNLDLQRDFAKLQNPGFESLGANGLIVGWQPRAGQAGRVEADSRVAHTGERSLKIVSADSVGAAVESHTFDIPQTGQLLVKAWVRANDLSPQTRLYALLSVERDSHQKRRYALLGTDVPLEDAWTQQQLFVDDLPLGASGKLRVQFLLVGPGTVWIDDVQLADVHFEASQRVELVKQLSAAKAALDEKKVLDCLALVDAYLPRYLVSHVPPELDTTAIATRPDSNPADATPSHQLEAAAESEDETGLRGKLRGWVPRIWR